MQAAPGPDRGWRRRDPAVNVVNAISKVRFASAKPQRVLLSKGHGLVAALLCLEAGQETVGEKGRWSYYVMAGVAEIKADAKAATLSAGQLAAADPGERIAISNTGEGRLIVLAVGRPS